MEELVPLQKSGEIPEVQYCNLEHSNKTVDIDCKGDNCRLRMK